MTHTPGPWHRNIKPASHYPVIFAGRNTHVAVVERRPNAEENEANCNLIAAAPGLLEALTLAVATIERLEVKHNGFSSVAGTLDVARAALAKAKGE